MRLLMIGRIALIDNGCSNEVKENRWTLYS